MDIACYKERDAASCLKTLCWIWEPCCRYLLEKHGLTAGECLFLDDMPVNVRGACEAGLHGVLFQNDFDRLMQEFQR